MADMRLLERTLAANVTWNRARIKLLARLLVALIAVKTVNLAEVASVLNAGALVDSNYKRLQRFFRHFQMPYAEVARLVVSLLGVARPFVITLDRTEWHFAKVKLNVLVLGIAYRGAAVPVLWAVLPKAGCTSFAERREIIEAFISLFGSESILYLTADREFHGRRFYEYLGERRIRFCLRARLETPLTTATRQAVALRRLLFHQRLGVKVYWSGTRRVWGQEVKVASLRLRADEWLVVVGSPQLRDLFAAYQVRWEIETLFGCLKTRGFCLEATHMTRPERLQSLVGVLALCFCWAIKAGIWSSEQRALKFKTHKRLAKSLFRTGFDCLRQVIAGCKGGRHLHSWRKAVQFLSCT